MMVPWARRFRCHAEAPYESFSRTGTWVCARRRGVSIGGEIAARAASARVASVALGRGFLAKQRLPERQRSHVAQACIHSRLLYHAGTWPALGKVAFAAFAGAFHRPLRRITATHRLLTPGLDRVRNVAVTSHLEVVTPAWALVAARLRLVARLTRGASAGLRALIQSQAGAPWREAVLASCLAMQKALAPKLDELPPPLAHGAVWEQFWSEFPGPWQQMVAKMLQWVRDEPSAAAAILAAIRVGRGLC